MARVTDGTARRSVPRATVAETIGVLAGVVGPTVAKGAILRRPSMVALAQRLDLDRRAVRRVQHLRDKYGPGPLLLRLPVRRQAIILSPAHLRRVLDETPEPFSAASSEKRGALAHFEPGAVLISTGPARAERRRFNADWPLVPFSGGPAICPGRNLVLLTTGLMLAALLDRADPRLLPPVRLDAARPLPGTLDHFALRFALESEGRDGATRRPDQVGESIATAGAGSPG